MGYALAEAARDAGAQVTLVSAPTTLEHPCGVQIVPVRTAKEMGEAVLDRAGDTDVLVMAAAVADFRPISSADQKIKKTDSSLVLELERTQDVLAAVATLTTSERPRVVVGFAAETENVIQNARRKLRAKQLDMLVANDVSATDSGFGVETNRVTLLMADGQAHELPLLTKTEVAERVMERVATLWMSESG